MVFVVRIARAPEASRENGLLDAEDGLRRGGETGSEEEGRGDDEAISYE
jgi:hypothetical protein